MTIRRLNFTGCQKIDRSDVLITVDGMVTPPRFELAHALGDYDFPQGAVVAVEAQAHWTLMRFDVGTVAAPRADAELVLSEFQSPDGILFRLKVLGSGSDSGLILGEADQIRPARPEAPGEANSLLPVQPAELGQQVWRLSFANSTPLLQINEKIRDWRSFLRRPVVQALLMPEIFRRMLWEALRNPADSDSSESWQASVFALASPAAGSRPADSDGDIAEDWVEEVVRMFATKHRLLRAIADWDEVAE
jgi:hypothetical protein